MMPVTTIFADESENRILKQHLQVLEERTKALEGMMSDIPMAEPLPIASPAGLSTNSAPRAQFHNGCIQVCVSTQL